MRFQKGGAKPANSGRRKGVRNKINSEISQRLAELDCDPIAGLAKLATDKKQEPALRARCYAELLEYVRPKLSRVEHTGPAGTPLFSLAEIRAYMQSQNDEPPSLP